MIAGNVRMKSPRAPWWISNRLDFVISHLSTMPWNCRAGHEYNLMMVTYSNQTMNKSSILGIAVLILSPNPYTGIAANIGT
jgi:hypothetical protein